MSLTTGKVGKYCLRDLNREINITNINEKIVIKGNKTYAHE